MHSVIHSIGNQCTFIRQIDFLNVNHYTRRSYIERTSCLGKLCGYCIGLRVDNRDGWIADVFKSECNDKSLYCIRKTILSGYFIVISSLAKSIVV